MVFVFLCLEIGYLFFWVNPLKGGSEDSCCLEKKVNGGRVWVDIVDRMDLMDGVDTRVRAARRKG